MKTFPGRNPLSSAQRGFTLTELLVVIAIIAIIAGISFPVVNTTRKKARMVTEISAARQLVTAYLACAADNDGELMPGFLAGATVQFPNGDAGSGPEAERYPWRLAPYLRWGVDGTYILEANRESVNGKSVDSSEYRYMVSLAPALGLNTYCVGGYQSASSMMAKNDVATRLGQIENPSGLVAFVSARTKTSSSGPQSGDVAGSFYVRPPVFSSLKWKTGAFDAKNASLDYGNVDFRHSRKAVVSFMDGSVQVLGIEDLRDMRLWARNADSATYSVKP
jgi:prepilin-type N-terminal cleavage/methylation domain-containing protein/prepilin-type processing-associated H-X9-DG protein